MQTSYSPAAWTGFAKSTSQVLFYTRAVILWKVLKNVFVAYNAQSVTVCWKCCLIMEWCLSDSRPTAHWRCHQQSVHKTPPVFPSQSPWNLSRCHQSPPQCGDPSLCGLFLPVSASGTVDCPPGRKFRRESCTDCLPFLYCRFPSLYCCLPSLYCHLPSPYCCLSSLYCCLLCLYCHLPPLYCCLPSLYCCLLSLYCCLPSLYSCLPPPPFFFFTAVSPFFAVSLLFTAIWGKPLKALMVKKLILIHCITLTCIMWNSGFKNHLA